MNILECFSTQEVAQQLKALAVPEEQSSVSSTHFEQLTTAYNSTGRSSDVLLRTLVHTRAQRLRHTHVNNFNLLE